MKPFIAWTVLTLSSFTVLHAQVIPPSSANKAVKSAAEQKAAPEKKLSAGPFHAKLVAVDKAGGIITVGKRTFLITSETKINKSGKAATLEEAVIGEMVSGYVKPNEQGKLVATKLNFGPKNEAPPQKASPKKKVSERSPK
jgi:hypothetical protein